MAIRAPDGANKVNLKVNMEVCTMVTYRRFGNDKKFMRVLMM